MLSVAQIVMSAGSFGIEMLSAVRLRSRSVVGGTGCGVGGQLRYGNVVGGTSFEVGG